MRTVTLELLRHGPAHNQLLSPLTPYLALCENHAPVTLNVPFEHNQFLHRLTALTYEFGTTQHAENQRQFQLQDTGRELGRLLASIPGLMAELNRERERSRGVIHLRLVLSASELALLPFELALASNGFPGSGQPLLLQGQAPLCLTREVRRVSEQDLVWPTKVRILFVCASPRGFPPVPADAHLLALRRAVDPWVGYFEEGEDLERRKQVDRRLTVITNASVRSIKEACASGDYTHVHVLAHGVAQQVGFDLRFGIALHDEDDPDGAPDVVGGERLASALRAAERSSRDGPDLPMVVTLASCNGSNVGSVVGAGASVAHALQEAGVPLVVAGQFPLTFGGSVQLVELMYERLLWGADPRDVLMDLRRRMHADRSDNHDWAALTAYASLPRDFEDQLCNLKIGRAKSAINVAMHFADRAVRRMSRRAAPDPRAVLDTSPDEPILERAYRKIRMGEEKLRELLKRLPTQKSEIWGLLGSTAKRHAEVRLIAAMGLDDPSRREKGFTQVLDLFADSRDDYYQSFKVQPNAAWALVQYLSLFLLLEFSNPPAGFRRASQRTQRDTLWEYWMTARALSRLDLDAGGERAGWARGNLIELAILAVLLDMSPAPGEADHVASARVHVTELVRADDIDRFQIYSTRRQLYRYVQLYPRVNPAFERLISMVQDLIALLPPDSDNYDDAKD